MCIYYLIAIALAKGCFKNKIKCTLLHNTWPSCAIVLVKMHPPPPQIRAKSNNYTVML